MNATWPYVRICQNAALAVFLFVTSLNCFSQNAFYDSLQRINISGKDDTFKVKALMTKAGLMAFVAPDSALFYDDSIIRLSTLLSYPFGIGAGYIGKATVSYQKGDYPLALFYGKKASNYITNGNNLWQTIIMNSSFADLYSELGDTVHALHYLNVTNTLLNKSPDSLWDWTLDKFVPKSFLLYRMDQNTAKVYLTMGKPDSAMFFVKRALGTFDSLFHEGGQWSALPVILGNVYMTKKDYQRAVEAFRIHTSRNFPNDIADNYTGRANAFLQMGLRDSAIRYGLEALQISKALPYPKGVLGAADLLSKAYEESNPAEALKYLHASVAERDSIYGKEKINQLNAIQRDEETRKRDAEEAQKAATDRIKFQAVLGGMFILLFTSFMLWRNNQHKKESNLKLQAEKKKVELTLEKLRSTQAQLVQSEKMASLGELTAGIAHEIQNPLNFVNNFAAVNAELIDELQDQLKSAQYPDAISTSESIKSNEKKIAEHGARADSIVKGMLEHSRTSSGEKELTDINQICDEYLRLAYHGMRAKDKAFNVHLETHWDAQLKKAYVVKQDLARVLLNIFNNAFYAVQQKQKMNGNSYNPTVNAKTSQQNGELFISIRDNGIGIPDHIKDKIFQPFFTTKPTGQGTGLGLSLSYDIIKSMGGEIKVESKEREWTQFSIVLNEAHK